MEVLKGNTRTKTTSHEARKARKHGNIPGILYGKNINNLLFEIGELELNRQITENGEHGILDVSIDGQNHRTLIKEIQRDPSTHQLLHLDLEEISGDNVVHTDIPISFSGEDMVVRNGGILQKEKSKVKVHCKGDKVIKSINVDVSGLALGDVIRVRDIEAAREIFFDEDPYTVIATVTDGNTNIVENPTVAITGESSSEE